MLDQFIESKTNRVENRRSRRLLFSTFSLLTVLSFSAVIWSLFSRDLVLASDSLDFSVVAAPIAETQPEKKVEERNENEKPKFSKPTKNQDVLRVADISRVAESSVIPDKISTIPNSSKERPKSGRFQISNIDVDPEVGTSTGGPNVGTGVGKVGNNSSPNVIAAKKNDDDDDTPPVVEKPKTIEKPEIVEKKKVTQSLGVVNGKAMLLPKPPYPAAAKAVGASGTVSVQITIDENGNVISASATSGHPLLRLECEKAARNAKFSPTLLSKTAVKATGVLTYNFIR